MNLTHYYKQLLIKTITVSFALVLLLIWTVYSVSRQTNEFRESALKVSTTLEKLTINNKNENILITQLSNRFYYNTESGRLLPVSETVIKTLLSKFNTTCFNRHEASDIDTNWHSAITLDSHVLNIGELNPVTKKVYVKSGNSVYSCDDLLLSISQVKPAQLLEKALPLNSITKINNVSLTKNIVVKEIAETEAKLVKEDVLKSFELTGKNVKGIEETLSFSLLKSNKPNYWFWYAPSLSLIYVIEKPTPLGVLSFLDE